MGGSEIGAILPSGGYRKELEDAARDRVISALNDNKKPEKIDVARAFGLNSHEPMRFDIGRRRPLTIPRRIMLEALREKLEADILTSCWEKE